MLFEKLMQMNEEINELYEKETKGYTIALLGNPNVGKSTVFNGLTGMKQHTGNWPGKTVELASGTFTHHDRIHEMIDLPGTYSLLAHSSEEEVARNFVCFEKCDVCLVVCDATMLERNMNLVLQTMEITNRVVVIVNLMDEAEKKHIHLDLDKLANLLQVEVVGMSARNGKGFRSLKEAIEKTAQKPLREWCVLSYDAQLQQAIERLAQTIHAPGWNHHFLALKLLDPQVEDEKFYAVLTNKEEVQTMVRQEQEHLKRSGCYEQFEDIIVNALQKKAKMICDQCVKIEDGSYLEKDMRMDRIVTHKVWGFLCMIVLLALIFWITIAGANVPSAYLSAFFVQLEAWLHQACEQLHVAKLLEGLFVDGMVKTAGWVIAVMLPPMAIFFPLFTLLEDFGYLPRIAFNLDGFFQKACTCGKQALTMAMGFGCNAVGVSGARIIDSPRERLIAILTNVFVPCNGRFPTLIKADVYRQIPPYVPAVITCQRIGLRRLCQKNHIVSHMHSATLAECGNRYLWGKRLGFNHNRLPFSSRQNELHRIFAVRIQTINRKNMDRIGRKCMADIAFRLLPLYRQRDLLLYSGLKKNHRRQRRDQIRISHYQRAGCRVCSRLECLQKLLFRFRLLCNQAVFLLISNHLLSLPSHLSHTFLLIRRC